MNPILPGGTIGILGGGQLARMMAFEARRMGYKVGILDPEPASPAGQVADFQVTASLDNLDAAHDLAAQCDVITLDTEHVPLPILEAIEKKKPVRPSPTVLGIIQDRLVQRRFIEAQGMPQPRHALIEDEDTLREAARQVGFPCVIKTRRSGYDGKGQARAAQLSELEGAWKAIGRAPAVLEAFIDFDQEISVIFARDMAGNVGFYPLAANVHRRHVLHLTRAPASVPQDLVRRAEMISAGLAHTLKHVGVMAVEFFLTRQGELLVNEIAPRTHNSGHYTFGAAATSQFEQHLRAICGLPLGNTSILGPVVMLNLLGDLWRQNREPDWQTVLSRPNAHLHLYGKKKAFPGRKMGHVLLFGPSTEEANELDPAEVAGQILAELEREPS